jgi:tyrosyl-tRNA synthetase
LAGLAETNKEAQRLVAQGGVLVDDAKVDDSRATIDAGAGKHYLLKVGKRRFARVSFRAINGEESPAEGDPSLRSG